MGYLDENGLRYYDKTVDERISVRGVAVNGTNLTPNQNKVVNITIDEKQKATLPTAGADNLGKIYQYIGQTTENYIHGFFYECREVSTDNYSWEPLATSAIYYSEEPNEAGGITVIISTTPPTP